MMLAHAHNHVRAQLEEGLGKQIVECSRMLQCVRKLRWTPCDIGRIAAPIS